MPESPYVIADTDSPGRVVERFYAALSARDAAAIEGLIDEAFAEDAVVRLPASLPYGGLVEGAAAIKRAFAGLARAAPGAAPVDPTTLELVRTTGDRDSVVAEVRFRFSRADGEVITTGAAEWFTFNEGRVVELRSFYADTAELTIVR